MFVGVMQIELSVPASRSLKDKRRVVRSLRDRLHRAHLVSVAEVGALDAHQTALLGVSMVSNCGAKIHATFDRITQKLESLSDARLVATQRDIFEGAQLPTELTTDDGEPLWTEDDRRRDGRAQEAA